jgi:DNA modification methylase
MTEKVIIGNAELWHGDCREILPTLPQFDLILTDPPYGIGEDGGKFRDRKGGGHRVLESLGWDRERPAAWLFGLMQEKATECVIWGGNYFADLLPPSKGWLYWNKLMGGDFSDGELAWTNSDRALRHFSHCNKEHGKEHPTQKPIRLIVWCLDFHPKAQTVCDPFMGSGTTGVACAQMGKAFTGIERERKYFDIACERIERAQAQGQLLPNEPVAKAEQASMF